MRIRDLLFGRAIATEESEDEQVSSWAGVPILGLDALASAAYGPEALLTVLLPLGDGALYYLSLLTPVTVTVLLTVFASYMQTIPAYPNGGGAYTVAKQNLGRKWSLIAAAALAVDYVLNVAVAIAAGIGALVSVVPALLPHTLALCLVALAFLTMINLRGVRSTGAAFMVPAYVFIACMLTMIAVGSIRAVAADFHPHPLIAPPIAGRASASASVALVLRAFANGCTALTGVEAVSNGVPIFRKPTVTNARRALSIIISALTIVLVGETVLCTAYRIVATEPGAPGFQSVLSMLLHAVFGDSVLYHVSMASVVALLVLSANTSFADFPRLCRILASDDFLPEPFVHRGRRLEFSYGVLLLSALSAILLVAFSGITDRLIPLFAVGALAAFTMSQVGMVGHWHRSRERHAKKSLMLNALGACATGTTLCVVMAAKFLEGAWITVLLVVGIVWLLLAIHAHYERVRASTELPADLDVGPTEPPLVVLPLRRWDATAVKALRFSLRLGSELVVIQVITQDRAVENLSARWTHLVERPAREHGVAAPRLVVLESEYRDLFGPLLRYIEQLGSERPNRQIAVVVPELVEPKWYLYLLHNHTSTLLKTLLLHRSGPQVVVISAPWHLDATGPEQSLLAGRGACARASAAPARNGAAVDAPRNEQAPANPVGRRPQ